jgi:hypothetical protein
LRIPAAPLAREQLLHGSLLDVALLGDEPIQRGDEGVHIDEGGGDGVLFFNAWWQC